MAWLPFNTTGPIITSSPLAAHTPSYSSRELANTLHPHARTHTNILLLVLCRAGDTQQGDRQRGQCGLPLRSFQTLFQKSWQKVWSKWPSGPSQFIFSISSRLPQCAAAAQLTQSHGQECVWRETKGTVALWVRRQVDGRVSVY